MVKASRPAASTFTARPISPTENSDEHDAEGQRVGALHPARRHRPAARAAHQGVDVGVVPHVERARRAGADRDAEDRDAASTGFIGVRAQTRPVSAVNTTSDITRGFSSAT